MTTWRRIGKNLFYFVRPKVTIPADFYLSAIENRTVQVGKSVISPHGFSCIIMGELMTGAGGFTHSLPSNTERSPCGPTISNRT